MNCRSTMNTDCLPPGRQGTKTVYYQKHCVPWRLGGFLFCLLLPLYSCQNHREPLRPAFFHWKTQLALDNTEAGVLDSLHCRYLYLKFLDIARTDGVIRPYALLEATDTTGLGGRAIIPCIFITNNVFQTISESELDGLVKNTVKAVNSVGAQFPSASFPEILFDCDWTTSTQAPFFLFLKKIRSQVPENCRLSVTIRLHQYKFPDRTGVPPADRGMLMLYNTGDIDDPDAINSIFQKADAEKYLTGVAPYPLPLDLALPLFSWVLVYRDGNLWKIVPEPDKAELRDTSRFAVLPGAHTNMCLTQKATFLAGQYLRPGDLLRLEEVDTATLRAAGELASTIRLAPDARVAFYHLDRAIIARYPARYLEDIVELIRH